MNFYRVTIKLSISKSRIL